MCIYWFIVYNMCIAGRPWHWRGTGSCWFIIVYGVHYDCIIILQAAHGFGEGQGPVGS